MPDVLAALRSASLCEVAWRGSGGLRVRGALPLVTESGPALAFPYADAEAARSLGTADSVLLTLSEPRSTGRAFTPLALTCTPRVTEDPEGDRFCAELLDQELRKYPPSRTLADSPLLRRENWWWLPRVVVDLAVTRTEPFHERAPEDHLLVVDTAGSAGVPEAAVARVRSRDPLEVDVTVGTPGPGPAVLFGQDASFPDLERWGQWAWQGTWDGAAFTATSSPARTGVPPTPGVLARWRRQRDLEKRCRAGIAAVG
jgi:hypothetical protein